MNQELLSKYKLKGSPTSGLAMATFGFFIGFAAVSLFGPVATNFDKVMHMPGLLLGFLVAAPQLTGSLLRIPFGAWVDRSGGKKPLLILLMLSIIGMIGLTVILLLDYPNHLSLSMYPLIFLFGLFSGSGVATFSVGVPQTSYWFAQKRQGFALGTYGGLGNTAPGIFGILLPIALAALGLINSYAIWFVFLIVGTVIYAIFTKDSYYFQLKKRGVNEEEAKSIASSLGQELFPSGNMKEALKISAKTPVTWALVVLYFTSFGGFLALTTWFPTYWVQFHGTSVGEAGLLMALGFSLLASFVRIYGGSLSDKIGGEKVALAGYIFVLVGAIILMSISNFGLDLVGEIIMGIGMGIANAAVFKMVPKYVTHAPGGASGWVGGIGAFGGFVVPPLLGLFTQVHGVAGFAQGFVLYVILAVVTIVISIGLVRRQKNRQQDVSYNKKTA